MIIRILKICGKSICRPFELIFNECISKKKLFNDRNKSRVNDKRSFISNPYLFMATHCVYSYTHYQGISVTIFFVRRQFYQTFLKLSGAFNLKINTITVTITNIC